VSVRVNLLPQATKAGAKATRQRGLAAALGLLLLLVLGGVYWWQSGEIREAEERLAQEELVAQGLQNEVSALSEYQELGVAQQAASDALVEVMGGEVSIGAILQDIAVGMPSDAQLDTLNITLNEPFGEPTFDPVTGVETVGTFNATAQTLSRHAPGVERLLLSYERFASLFDLHADSSTLLEREDDVDVVSLQFDGLINDAARTGRYADGLPEELR
jgi:Tfp pilus assembly protein PilN